MVLIMSRIALVQAPFWTKLSPPFAIASLSAYLRSKGHEVFVYDINIEFSHKSNRAYHGFWNFEKSAYHTDTDFISDFLFDNKALIDKYIDLILSKDPLAVAFSVQYTSRLLTMHIARQIKQKDPKIKIILGGLYVSAALISKDLLDNNSIDFIVRGEGEETLSELIEAIEKNKKSCPKGVLMRNMGGIVYGGDRELIKNLDSLPFPDLSDFDYSLYDEINRIETYSSRGCVKNCIFCNETTFWKRYRYRTGKRIFGEIEYHLRKRRKIGISTNHLMQSLPYRLTQWLPFKETEIFNKLKNSAVFSKIRELIISSKISYVNTVYFNDSLCNGNLRELESFCDCVIQSYLNKEWEGLAVIRPDMTPQFLKKLKKSGCYSLGYGLESGSQKVLDSIRKNITIADAERVIRETHDAGIGVVVNFMMGFPGEDNADFKESIQFLRRNAKYITLVNPSLGFCNFSDGSYGYAHRDDLKIRIPKDDQYWESLDGKNTYPDRLGRFEKLCKAIANVGLKTSSPLDPEIYMPRKWYLLGNYYYFIKDYKRAQSCFKKSYMLKPKNRFLQKKIKAGHVKKVKIQSTLSNSVSSIGISS
jgi:anaerobic magnesium-protoporphyrin IX monomethyl ester cyclase